MRPLRTVIVSRRNTEILPVLWDCDSLLGPKGEHGEDSYVLSEINVSSIAPNSESAIPYIAEATVARVRETRRRRGFTSP